MVEEKPPKLEAVPKPKQNRAFITIEVYERMAKAYLVDLKRSIRSLSAATGVSNETASKAISKGWPERKWASLAERAALFDRAKNAKRPEPLTTEEVQALKAFLELKVESVNALRGISGFAQGAVSKLNAALERATADRQGTRRRVVVDVYGSGKSRREVHKTVIEDVILPPYLPDVAMGARAMAGIVAMANDGVRRWMGSLPSESLDRGAGLGGWDALTSEQQDFIIQNEGRLPPGVTREMLGRTKPGA